MDTCIYLYYIYIHLNKYVNINDKIIEGISIDILHNVRNRTLPAALEYLVSVSSYRPMHHTQRKLSLNLCLSFLCLICVNNI